MKGYLSSADGVFPLSPKVTTIGREGCDLIIKSGSVENQHSFIEFNEQDICYVIQDLNTAQGTYVNDCRVQNAAVRLAAGDTIRFGYAGQPYQLQVDSPTSTYTAYTPASQRTQWSQSQPLTVITPPRQTAFSSGVQSSFASGVQSGFGSGVQSGFSAGGAGQSAYGSGGQSTFCSAGQPGYGSGQQTSFGFGGNAGSVAFTVDSSLPSISNPPQSTAAWIPQQNALPRPFPPGVVRSRPLSAGAVRRPGPSMSPGSTTRSITGAWIAPPVSKTRTTEPQETTDQLLQEKEQKILHLNQEVNRLANVEFEISRRNQTIDELKHKVSALESQPGTARSEKDPAQITYRVAELEEEIASKMSENAILKAQITRINTDGPPESMRRELGEKIQECQSVRTELLKTKKDKDITSGLVTQMQRDTSTKDNTINRLNREIENQKRELREKDVEIAAITAKFTRVRESEKAESELQLRDKEFLELKSKYNSVEAKLKEATDTIQSMKDEYRATEEKMQGNEEDLRKFRKELEDSKKETTELTRGEHATRVDLETVSKRFERFRNRVVQVTFSTPGIKCPDEELSDDELIETMKKVVDERTSFHRKIQDMKDEVKIASSSKKEILDKLAKLKGFLKTSRDRFNEKGRLSSQLKSEISMLESVTVDQSLTFIKDHVIGMLKDELAWELQTETSLFECGVNVNLSSDAPFKHIENLSHKYKAANQQREEMETRLNEALSEHERQTAAIMTSLGSENDTAVKDAVEKTKLEYEEKMNSAIDEIRVLELEKRESAIAEGKKTISELEESLDKLRNAMTEREESDVDKQIMTADALARAEEIKKSESELRQELDELRIIRAKEVEASTSDKDQLNKDFDKDLQAYKEQINQHSVTICAMEERLNKVMKKNKELNNEIYNLKQQNQQLKNQPAPPRITRPVPPPKPEIIVQKPTAEIKALEQTIQILRQENFDIKRKIQDQNNVVVGLRRDLAGASARLSDMTGELSDAQKEQLEKNQSELKRQVYEITELRQQLTKVSHTADSLNEEIKAREIEITKQKSALIKYKNLANDKENRIRELEKFLDENSTEQKKQFAILSEEGRITSELTALGAQCRGERHEQVVGRQREALAELRMRIKELETARPNIPNHDQALQQVVLLKKELAEIRSQQALAENALDASSTLDREVNKARGLVMTPNFDMEMEKCAHRETMEALDESEKSYLNLLRSCAACLEIEQCSGLRSMAHIAREERERLAEERDSMCQSLLQRIKVIKERLDRKEDMLHGYETDLAKLRQAEELANLRQDQVDGLANDVRTKTEESEYLRELLKRTKARLDQEKRLNSSIKEKKSLHSHVDSETVDEQRPRPRHQCPIEDPMGKVTARRSAQKEKLKRKDYEIATLKKELGQRENQLCKTTARLVTVEKNMNHEDIEAM